MQGSLDQPPIVLRARRALAMWLMAIFSAIFTVIGLLMLATAAGGASTGSSASLLGSGLFTAALFGFVGGIAVYSLVQPARLEIGPSGITQTVLWRTRKLAWTDVYNFRPTIIGLTNKTVGFDYLKPPPKRAALLGVNRSLVGVDGVVPVGMELAPAALADLLNDARERWLPAADGAPQSLSTPAAPMRVPSSTGFAGARMNRKIYWLWVAGIFAVSLVLRFAPGLRFVTLAWSIRIYAVRLHDIGRSGWWQAAVYVVEILVALLLGRGGVQHLNLGLAVAGFVHIVFTAVLGAIPGDTKDNRFGPAPGQPSPLAAAETFR